MQLKNLIFAFILIFLFFITSCGKISTKREIERYREINPLEQVTVNLNRGDVEIVGWSRDFVEIEIKRMIFSGLANDINLITIDFLKDAKNFLINGNVPARVNGSVFMRIYLPFMLLKANLNLGASNLSMTKFFGNSDIVNSEGSIFVDFYGTFLRVYSSKGAVDVNVKSSLPVDISAVTEKSDIKINISEIGRASFLDVKSSEGDILLNLFTKIEHELFATSRNKNIAINYKLNNLKVIDGEISYLSGKLGSLKSPFDYAKIYLSNVAGKIIVNQAK